MSCMAGGGGGDGVGDVLSWRLKSAAEPTLTTIPCCLPEKKKKKEIRLHKPPKNASSYKRLFVTGINWVVNPHNCCIYQEGIQ